MRAPIPAAVAAAALLLACGDSGGVVQLTPDAGDGGASPAGVVPDASPAPDTPDASAEEPPDVVEDATGGWTGDVLADVLAPAADVAPETLDTPPWCPTYAAPVAVGALPDGITEASGLVVSALDPDRLWLHNDSGDGPNLFAVSTSGALLATVHLPGALAYDWEDLSAGPCAPGDPIRGCLYVGDVGDNATARPAVSIHRVVEPAAPVGSIDLPFETMSLIYPDGPHDCESVVVDEDAVVWLITKEWGAGVFRLYTAPYEPGGVAVPLTFVSEHDSTGVPGDFVALTTAADLRPDTGRLAVRLYGGAVEYRLPLGAGLGALTDVDRLPIPAAEEAQGEAIGYGPEGYFHVSEGAHATIWYVGCQ